jgi:recombination protein RecR
MRRTTGTEIENLIQLLSKLPGLGRRSARRAALHLIKNRDKLLNPLAEALADTGAKVSICSICGNLDTTDPCTLCRDERRDRSIICVVEEVADLWALERAAAINALYHVLGGTLSALEGRRPEDLNLAKLFERAARGDIKEIVLALNLTVEGQTTAHYIIDHLKDSRITISRLAHGVPVGGELDYLDEGTLTAAIRQRRPV